MLTMQKGENVTFYIASDYAYGENGIPSRIPPKSPLIYDVELVDIVPAP